jgi:anti-anti-sigma factor
MGELDNGTVLLLAREVATILAREAPPLEAVVVDMTEVAAVSAAGLRALYAAQHLAAGKGITIRVVVRPNSSPDRMLDATEMRAVLDVYSSRAAAVTAYSRDQFVREMRNLWA